MGFFLACVPFFPCSFSAESCTLNLLYGISKLPCKVDQRELESYYLPLMYTVLLQNFEQNQLIKKYTKNLLTPKVLNF